eukprot:scaffold276_cov268-Pinguiococcus_pyrenoidosus.AAC.1
MSHALHALHAGVAGGVAGERLGHQARDLFGIQAVGGVGQHAQHAVELHQLARDVRTLAEVQLDADLELVLAVVAQDGMQRKEALEHLAVLLVVGELDDQRIRVAQRLHDLVVQVSFGELALQERAVLADGVGLAEARDGHEALVHVRQRNAGHGHVGHHHADGERLRHGLEHVQPVVGRALLQALGGGAHAERHALLLLLRHLHDAGLGEGGVQEALEHVGGQQEERLLQAAVDAGHQRVPVRAIELSDDDVVVGAVEQRVLVHALVQLAHDAMRIRAGTLDHHDLLHEGEMALDQWRAGRGELAEDGHAVRILDQAGQRHLRLVAPHDAGEGHQRVGVVHLHPTGHVAGCHLFQRLGTIRIHAGLLLLRHGLRLLRHDLLLVHDGGVGLSRGGLGELAARASGRLALQTDL